MGHRIPRLTLRTKTRPHNRPLRLDRTRHRRRHRRHHMGILGRRRNHGILLGRTTNLRPRPTHLPITQRTNRRILRTLPNVRTPLRRHRPRPLGPNHLGPIRNRRTSLPNSPSNPSHLPSSRPPSPKIRQSNPRNLRPRSHRRRHARRAIRTFCNLALSSVRPIVHRSEQFSMRPRIRRFRLVLP